MDPTPHLLPYNGMVIIENYRSESDYGVVSCDHSSIYSSNVVPFSSTHWVEPS